MNTLQTSLASLLGVALLFSLPGLYFYTLGSPGTSRNSTHAATTSSAGPNQSWNTSQLVDIEPVPLPSSSAVPETEFELTELTKVERRKILKTMMIDVNEAEQSQLERISGVGPSTAQRIIQYREENGPFGSVEELDNVSGIGPVTVEKLKSEIKVSGRIAQGVDLSAKSTESSSSSESSSQASGPTININTASSSELQQLNGIGPATAEKIINYREKSGGISNLSNLENVSGIGPTTVDKLRNSVTF